MSLATRRLIPFRRRKYCLCARCGRKTLFKPARLSLNLPFEHVLSLAGSGELCVPYEADVLNGGPINSCMNVHILKVSLFGSSLIWVVEVLFLGLFNISSSLQWQTHLAFAASDFVMRDLSVNYWDNSQGNVAKSAILICTSGTPQSCNLSRFVTIQFAPLRYVRSRVGPP